MDISLVPTEQLADEFAKRFDASIVCGITAKFVDDEEGGRSDGVLFHKGEVLHCLGIAVRMQHVIQRRCDDEEEEEEGA